MSIQYIKEKIKLYPFHFSNIFYLIDEFKKFTPEKLKNKDFYFVERVITKDNKPAFISYILDSNLNFENLLSDIQSVIQKAEYNQILKNSSDYSDEAKVSKNRIEELIKESREKADLSPEEKKELLIHYLNIAFNFPTISKTVDKIAYEKMIRVEKTAPPIIFLKINGEKVYNAIDNEQIGVQIINDKEKFFFDEVLKILIAPRNQGQILSDFNLITAIPPSNFNQDFWLDKIATIEKGDINELTYSEFEKERIADELMQKGLDQRSPFLLYKAHVYYQELGKLEKATQCYAYALKFEEKFLDAAIQFEKINNLEKAKECLLKGKL